MWYVKDEFSDKVYFKSNDVRKAQDFACSYNKRFKFSSQRMFSFTISTFTGICLFWETYIDVNNCNKKFSFFDKCKYFHPFAIKNYERKHIVYLNKKYELIRKLCKKYHLWSYTGNGRKCDGFDF